MIWRVLGWCIKTVFQLLILAAWSIWGLLGALPGGSIIKAVISVSLLYSTGFLDLLALYFEFDMTPIHTAVSAFTGDWSLPNPLKGLF